MNGLLQQGHFLIKDPSSKMTLVQQGILNRLRVARGSRVQANKQACMHLFLFPLSHGCDKTVSSPYLDFPTMMDCGIVN